MNRLKKAGKFLLAVALSLVPHSVLYYAQLLRQLPSEHPRDVARLEQLQQHYGLEPPNPLRDATDNRVFPFGPRK